MQIHDLEQGSPDWHLHRSNYFNASDAPAMLGVSKYKTRAELLHEMHTGVSPEVGEYTQRRFDEGHRFEALARTLAEEIVGEPLYPVTGTEGKHSASFDGLTMLEDVAYEHKRLNDAIRAAQTVDDLDQMYHVQMEQQCLVSGATKFLFLATNWDEQGNLLEAKHFWYEPNLELRERIIQGWIQLEKDLAEYVPFEIAEPAKAAAPKDLPVVSIQVRGELTTSNLNEVTPYFDRFLSQARTDLKTDDDFAVAEAESKLGRETAKRCKLTAKAVVDQIMPVSEVVRTLEEYAAKFDALALKQEKAVKLEKEVRKASLIADAREKFYAHTAVLQAEIKEVSLVIASPDFVAAIKGLKLLSSMQDALDTALANGKIATDAIAKDIRTKLAWYKENAAGYEFLFADLQSIIQKPADDFQMLVQNRIDQHKMDEARKLEAERARIQAEEQRKAEEKVAKAAAAQAPAEAPKPVLVKSEAKPVISPALIGLARHDAVFFRKKYSAIDELAGVMREIDLFLKAQEKTA